MNQEIQALAAQMEVVLQGTPWYGKSVGLLLDEMNPDTVFLDPPGKAHRGIDILYHMITWATFTLHRIEGNKSYDLDAAEQLDWREIDPATHGWEEGIAELQAVHQQIIYHLREKDDEFLDQKVDYRDYNFRYLINGLIQHNIYRAGQIACLSKIFSKEK